MKTDSLIQRRPVGQYMWYICSTTRLSPTTSSISILHIWPKQQHSIPHTAFADDSIIYCKITSETDINIFQCDLIKLQTWSNKWQMEFNQTKPDCTWSKICYKLTWANHITDIVSKSSNVLGMIKRPLGPCKPDIKETAYNMLVRPKLEWVCPIWNPHATIQIKRLENIQHCAARFAKNDHRCETIHHWMATLWRRTIIKQAMAYYKISNNITEHSSG